MSTRVQTRSSAITEGPRDAQ